VSPFGKQFQPTLGNFLVTPSGDHIWPASQHHVQVVAQHRVGQAIDAKHAGEKLQPMPNPYSAVLKSLSANRIIAAQEGPPNASLDTMKNLHIRRINDFITSLPGHEFLPDSQQSMMNAENPTHSFLQFNGWPLVIRPFPGRPFDFANRQALPRLWDVVS
jgi:hypothetical protein